MTSEAGSESGADRFRSHKNKTEGKEEGRRKKEKHGKEKEVEGRWEGEELRTIIELGEEGAGRTGLGH